MGYFSSPKNRALWDRELARLKEEKELRRQGLSGPGTTQTRENAGREQVHPGEKITFRQLLAEEQSEKQEKRQQKRDMVRTREFKLSKTPDRTMEKGL